MFKNITRLLALAFLVAGLSFDVALAAKTLVVKNNVGETIFYLRAAKASTNAWGDDLMRSDEVLSDGTSKTFSLQGADAKNCNWDFQATDLDEEKVWLVENQNICTNKTVTFTEDHLTSTGEGNDVEVEDGSAVTIENNLGETIFYLRARPAGASDWGEDLLDQDGNTNTVSDGDSFKVNIPGLGGNRCMFDLQASGLSDRGEIKVLQNVNLCNSNEVTFGASDGNKVADNSSPDGKITVSNNAGETIFYLYARQSGSNDWGEDLLKDAGQELYTFQDGETGSLKIPGLSRSNCKFDFKATRLDGTVITEMRNLNLCNNPSVTFTSSGNNNSNNNNSGNTNGSITVSNSAGETIFYLYARKSGSNDWGEDLLKDAGQELYTFQDGETGSLKIPGLSRSNCKFDFKATRLDGTVITETRNLNLCNDDRVNFTASGNSNNNNSGNTNGSITVSNSAGETIFYLYARKSGSGSDWGEDLLKDAGEDLYTFQDGETGTLKIPGLSRSNCKFDFKATRLDGSVIEEASGLNLCNNPAYTFSSNGSVNNNNNNSGSGSPISVTNNVGETIFYLYARPSGSNDWGTDLLKDAGDDMYTFQDNESGTITIPGLGDGNCRFDLKATALDETNVLAQVNGVNLCSSTSLTFRRGNSGNNGNNGNNGNAGPQPGANFDYSSIKLENQTNDTLISVKVRPDGNGKFSEVFTAKDPNEGMGNMGSVNLNKFKGQCVFDIRAVGMDATYEKAGVNICNTKKFRLMKSDAKSE